MKIEKMLEEFANEQFYMMGNDEEFDFVSFDFEKSGVTIVNPYLDESGIYNIDPEKYYGKDNFEEWKKEAISVINKK